MATSIAIAVLVAALAVVYFQARSGGDIGTRPAYYLNLDTGEFFTDRLDAVSPVPAPSGARGVRANVCTCGECEPGEWFGYLGTYTSEARRAFEEQGMLSEADEDYLIRPLDNGSWIPHFSREGEALRDRTDEHCPGEPDAFPRQCRP